MTQTLPFAVDERKSQSSKRKEYREFTAAVLGSIAFAVLANVPMWIAIPALNLERHGLFSLDYFLLAAISMFIPRLFASALLLSFISADIFCGICQSYALPPIESIRYANSLFDLSHERLFASAAVAIVALIASFLAPQLTPSKMRSERRAIVIAMLAAVASVLLLIDIANIVRYTGKLPSLRIAVPSDSVNLASFKELRLCRMPTIGLARIQYDYERNLNFAGLPTLARYDHVPSATAQAFAAAPPSAFSGPNAPDVVLVLVESWGLAADPALRSALTQPYSDPSILARYRRYDGSVPFYGSTIAGEARELCNSKMGFHLLNASAQELRNCLPDRMAAMGYEDIAVHGNAGHMFDRIDWYKTLGFDESWFREQLRHLGLPTCVGAATGICDSSVADWISNRLKEPSPKPLFIHWMTLNSHLPVPTPVPISNVVPCSQLPIDPSDSALCSWTQLVRNVNRSVMRLALTQFSRPTVIIAVGDHAPPFGNSALRQRFSSSQVPYVVLIPRSLTSGPSAGSK